MWGNEQLFSYQPVRVKSEEIRDTSGIILVWEGMFKRHRLYHSPLIRLWQIRHHKTYGTLTHTPVINGHLWATIINDVSVNKLNRQTFKRSHSFKIRAQMKDGGVCTFPPFLAFLLGSICSKRTHGVCSVLCVTAFWQNSSNFTSNFTTSLLWALEKVTLEKISKIY